MNIVQIQNRVQELPNTPQTLQYLNAAMNGQIATVPPYIAAAELKRRESEGMMDQLAKGAAQGPQPTVKDQLEQKAGIMALMGQQQPMQRPPIPQPAAAQPQPQAEGGIDQLPVKGDMFGMAGGGIVAFNGEEGSEVPAPYETAYDRMNRKNREEAERRAREAEARGRAIAADPDRPVMRRLVDSGIREDLDRKRRLQQEAQMNVRLAQGAPYVDERLLGITAPEETVGTMGKRPGTLAEPEKKRMGAGPAAPRPAAPRPVAAPAQTQEGILAALEKSPEFKRLLTGIEAKNPYAEPQESQDAYTKRVTEGIRSQLPGGKMPWETSEERLKGIEARRAQEDAAYQTAATGEGRRMDNLITLLTGMGAGSFGRGGAKGVQAVQAVERAQREEALKRQDMRDQQAMKLADIRALNDQAQFALASGNIKEYERIQQEIKKLKTEFEKDQATLAKSAAGLKQEAAKADQEVRDKALDRASRERIARLGIEARAGGEKQTLAELKALQTSLRDQLKDPSMFGPKGAQLRAQLAEVNAAIAKMAGLSTMAGAPGAQSPGGTTRMRFDAQGNLIQ